MAGIKLVLGLNKEMENVGHIFQCLNHKYYKKLHSAQHRNSNYWLNGPVESAYNNLIIVDRRPSSNGYTTPSLEMGSDPDKRETNSNDSKVVWVTSYFHFLP